MVIALQDYPLLPDGSKFVHTTANSPNVDGRRENIDSGRMGGLAASRGADFNYAVGTDFAAQEPGLAWGPNPQDSGFQTRSKSEPRARYTTVAAS